MTSAVSKSFDAPDEVRTPDKTRMEVFDLGGAKAARLTVQPGWKWSDCIKPVVGGESCQTLHIGTAVAGHLHVRHDDGTEIDVVPGGVYRIDPGHDAWVVGDEPFTAYEFDSSAAENYARPPS
ncbi:MAG TPA: cupin domain-containing protein [Acidimicrobiales bacterium]|jgi:hypothetical protein